MNTQKLLILFLGIGSLAFADNLKLPANLKCKGISISMATPESSIEANCKADKIRNDVVVANGQSAQKVKDFTTDDGIQATDVNLSKIKFIADDGSRHICYYKNNRLLKCRLVK